MDSKPQVKNESEKKKFSREQNVRMTHTPSSQIHTYKWCLLRKWRRRRRWWAISWLGYFRKNKISKIPVHKDPIKRGTETDRQTDRQTDRGRCHIL